MDQKQEFFNMMCDKFYLDYKRSMKTLSGFEKINHDHLKLVEEVISDRPPENEIACKLECSYCCNLRVTAFPHEIVGIYFYLNKHLSANQLSIVKEDISNKSKKVKGLGELDHYKTNIRCPLLSQNNTCSVYSSRPISCSTYHSKNVSSCKSMFENPDSSEGTDQYAVIHQMRQFTHDVCTNVLDHIKHDKNQYELISSLDELFKNPSIIQRWKKGKPFLS